MGQPNPTLATSTSAAASSSHAPRCTPFTLPSGGVLEISPTSTITLPANALFTPECHNDAPSITFTSDSDISLVTDDIRDPFYASVTPQAYATGAATVISWMLCFMLLITPRTFFVGGAGGGFGLLGRRGMISGAQGGASVIGVGSRPWLQKVAALTVAISMTIATADTFSVAERQYATGFMNAEQLRSEVVNSTEIKVSRIVSDIFLWLALVQTLIRLFPRHKEKVLIKWIGFALIILDLTFSCLNSFMNRSIDRTKRFKDAIPALSYLFQLALSMLYAAWVLYYAIRKRRFAFYHPLMWNISIVALLSITAIFTPVVFFITDISDANVAGWGDYFRWVGAAAASVIVWEWVERIEALEREEKKDDILGREVFDGDEMLEVTGPDDDVGRGLRNRFFRGHLRNGNHGSGNGEGGTMLPPEDNGRLLPKDTSDLSQQNKAPFTIILPDDSAAHRRLSRVLENDIESAAAGGLLGPPLTTPPPVAVSPVSRADTSSAASTVYTIRYHTINHPSTPLARPDPLQYITTATEPPPRQRDPKDWRQDDPLGKEISSNPSEDSTTPPVSPTVPKNRWPTLFKRRRTLPPAEVRKGQIIRPVPITPAKPLQPQHNYGKWDLKGRVGAFAAEHGEKWMEKRSALRDEVDEADLPVTIIPAQPRGRTWSPEVLLDGSAPTDRPLEEQLGNDAPDDPSNTAAKAEALRRTPLVRSASSGIATRMGTPIRPPPTDLPGRSNAASPGAIAPTPEAASTPGAPAGRPDGPARMATS